MRMGLSDLLKERKITQVKPDREMAARLLALAKDDLTAAEKNLLFKPRWALAIAYNSMLQAGRALMAFMGYRAFSQEHHATVVCFCASVLPRDSSVLVLYFDKLRGRRHDVVYGGELSVAEGEAERAIKKARSFLHVIEQKIKSKSA